MALAVTVTAEQLVDLAPAFGSGGGTLALLQGRALRPAGRVRGDFLARGLAEAMPQVPAAADLHRVRQCLAGGLAVDVGAENLCHLAGCSVGCPAGRLRERGMIFGLWG